MSKLRRYDIFEDGEVERDKYGNWVAAKEAFRLIAAKDKEIERLRKEHEAWMSNPTMYHRCNSGNKIRRWPRMVCSNCRDKSGPSTDFDPLAELAAEGAEITCLKAQLQLRPHGAEGLPVERIRIQALEEVLREISLVHHACECRAIIEALMMEKPNAKAR